MSAVAKRDEMRGKVLRAEAIMREMPQVELRTTHYFADGMYAREVEQEAGTVIIGKVHKKEHFFIVLKGSVKVVMDDEPQVYAAPAVINSKPGTKRAIYALEDSSFMTVHRTKKRNLDKIEREIIEEDRLARFDSGNNVKALTQRKELA